MASEEEEIEEIKKMDNEVEQLKQVKDKILEEIADAPKEEAKSPQVITLMFRRRICTNILQTGTRQEARKYYSRN